MCGASGARCLQQREPAGGFSVYAEQLSTAIDAHEVLVMDAVRINERGSHAELLVANGRYAQRWALQH